MTIEKVKEYIVSSYGVEAKEVIRAFDEALKNEEYGNTLVKIVEEAKGLLDFSDFRYAIFHDTALRQSKLAGLLARDCGSFIEEIHPQIQWMKTKECLNVGNRFFTTDIKAGEPYGYSKYFAILDESAKYNFWTFDYQFTIEVEKETYICFDPWTSEYVHELPKGRYSIFANGGFVIFKKLKDVFSFNED